MSLRRGSARVHACSADYGEQRVRGSEREREREGGREGGREMKKKKKKKKKKGGLNQGRGIKIVDIMKYPFLNLI